MFESEYPMWRKYYPLGKTVLDVGSDLESFCFFSLNGCKVIPIGDSFGSHVDAIKIDIDGGEWGLIVETHGFKPKLTLLHKVEGSSGATRIYRLDRGKQIPKKYPYLIRLIKKWLK